MERIQLAANQLLAACISNYKMLTSPKFIEWRKQFQKSETEWAMVSAMGMRELELETAILHAQGFIDGALMPKGERITNYEKQNAEAQAEASNAAFFQSHAEMAMIRAAKYEDALFNILKDPAFADAIARDALDEQTQEQSEGPSAVQADDILGRKHYSAGETPC